MLAQPKAPHWTPSLYGDPALSLPDDQHLRIAVNNPPGGLMFDRDGLSRLAGYRLRIDGVPVAGNVILRLDVGDRTPVWIHARPGVEERVVYGASAIKVWIYADLPFTYDLRGLTLENCGSCLPDVKAGFREAVAAADRSYKAGDTRAAIGHVLNLASYMVTILVILLAVGAAAIDLGRRLLKSRNTART